jgi:hypothetical protein
MFHRTSTRNFQSTVSKAFVMSSFRRIEVVEEPCSLRVASFTIIKLCGYDVHALMHPKQLTGDQSHLFGNHFGHKLSNPMDQADRPKVPDLLGHRLFREEGDLRTVHHSKYACKHIFLSYLF